MFVPAQFTIAKIQANVGVQQPQNKENVFYIDNDFFCLTIKNAVRLSTGK